MRHRLIFFILGIIFYAFSAILALNGINFDLILVSISIVFLALGLFADAKQKMAKKPFKQRLRINKEDSSIDKAIPKIARFLQQRINKKGNVGVEYINEISSLKVDIIRYFPEYYTHKQIEKKGDFLFIRMKKRVLGIAA